MEYSRPWLSLRASRRELEPITICQRLPESLFVVSLPNALLDLQLTTWSQLVIVGLVATYLSTVKFQLHHSVIFARQMSQCLLRQQARSAEPGIKDIPTGPGIYGIFW